MKNKQQLIEEFLKTPIEVGDRVCVKVNSRYKGQEQVTVTYKTTDVTTESISYKDFYGETHTVPIGEVTKSTSHIGANHFEDLPISIIDFSIKEILNTIQYDVKENIWNQILVVGESDSGIRQLIPCVNFNSTIVDKTGQDVCFQKPLYWDLIKKQKLISSIYNGVGIGMIILRKRSYNWIRNRIDKVIIENTARYDIIDGKNRIHTIIEFINGGFKDSFGNYFNDLSDDAQHEFMNSFVYYGYTPVSNIPEDATDEQVMNIYNAYNHDNI